MEQTAIFTPFLGMLMLTLIVWVYMYIKRLGYLSGRDIDPQSLATPDKIAQIIPDEINNPANNLKNLFELPVLFYAICLYLYVTQQVDTVHLYSAYAFFVFRAIHSVVQCTFNKVMVRFAVYAAASIALWLMVIRAAL